MKTTCQEKEKYSFSVRVVLFQNIEYRKYWIQPFTSARLLKGAFTSMFTDLKENEEKIDKLFFYEC